MKASGRSKLEQRANSERGHAGNSKSKRSWERREGGWSLLLSAATYRAGGAPVERGWGGGGWSGRRGWDPEPGA